MHLLRHAMREEYLAKTEYLRIWSKKHYSHSYTYQGWEDVLLLFLCIIAEEQRDVNKLSFNQNYQATQHQTPNTHSPTGVQHEYQRSNHQPSRHQSI